MKAQLLKAYRFHFEWSACIVGEHAVSAIALARAELAARELGWQFDWQYDDAADLSWMSAAEREREHEVLGCILRDAEGESLGSLWGIVDASDNYRRTIEAELASEANACAELDAQRAALASEVVSGVLGEVFA